MTRTTLFWAVLAMVPATPRIAAGSSAQTVPASEAPPPEAAPPESERKLEIHGYLSQAFANSDGHQMLGIPDDGTFDYRTAALQFRATLSPKDSFLIQFSQERLGESPIMAFANEIDLDWVFYERRLGVVTSLRVGRVRVPFGIFSEFRFVGPLLPFYRAPDVFYPVGGYAFSSVNGLMISRSLFAARPFSLDADLYAGEWSFPQDGSVERVQAKKGLGGQLWLRTPLQGLRFGFGGNRSTWSNLLNDVPGARVTHHRWVASVDGDFERFRLSAEYEEESSAGVEVVAGYVLGSLHVNDKLNLNLQASRSHLRVDLAAFDEELSRDDGAGLSYAFRPDLVAKAEYHWAKGRRFEEPGVTVFAPPLSANYVIVSLAVLF
jgi:hypothetical protein